MAQATTPQACEGISRGEQGRQQPPSFGLPHGQAAPRQRGVRRVTHSLPGAAAGPDSAVRWNGRAEGNATRLRSAETPSQAPSSSRCAGGVGASCRSVRSGPPSPAAILRSS